MMLKFQGSGSIEAIIWYVLALLSCSIVALVNGGALYYFDTAGYLEQGRVALSSFGFAMPETMLSVSATEGTADAAENDGVVVGSRSVIYSVFIAAMRLTIGLSWVVVIHAVLLITSVWLFVRVAVRTLDPGRSVARITAISVLLASLGSLPFYVAFLMPDIFAPILLLVVATFAAFARSMTILEITLGLCLGGLAVVTHPSHLLIAIAMIPIVVLSAVLVNRQGWWLAPLCVVLIVGAGIAERLIFVEAVKIVRSADVVYQPFLTVRTIADGPGYSTLEEICPDADVETCKLFEVLEKSTNPLRLTASHIMFETKPDLASYQLLSEDVQKKIADEQVEFFTRVLLENPVALCMAFLRNTLAQVNSYSVEYTVPTSQILDNVNAMTDIAPKSFDEVRLLDKRAEVSRLTIVHGVIYGLSTLLIVIFVVLPMQAPPISMRVFAMIILVGILVNAFVCGGISQPSGRYGARVAFLFPLVSTLLILFYAGALKKTHSNIT